MDVIDYSQFKQQVRPSDKILVLLSGGIDSTAVLYYLLKDTECPIHVHHVHFENRERRWEPEQAAIKNILEFMKKNVRPIQKYTESTFKFNIKGFIAYDVHVNGFIASQVIIGEKKVKYLAIGRNADDMVRSDSNVRGDRVEKILDVCLDDMVQQKPTIVRPVDTLHKNEIIATMPQELVDLTWSCRTPKRNEQTFRRCGRCVACKEFNQQHIWQRTPDIIEV